MIRKSLIYKTEVEYGDYTLNHIQGCSHGCKYPCYAYMMAKRFGKVKSYEEWIHPQIVENTMQLLAKELPRFKDKISLLHLCFTTDPFMYGHEDICQLSMQVLQRANAHSVRCSVLTKGILPIELAELPLQNEYGITVVSLDDDFIRRYEPGAAPIHDRIDALKALSEKGCKTWVSVEPYPTPNIIKQSLSNILDAVSFADRIIFGRLNYNKVVSEYKQHKEFYNQCAEQVIQFCKDNQIDYHIKTGTITE
ncbi:radical SAM protein [Pseudoflavonifractor sp. An176]|uniref:radical SAM protein n=1 Tax=Pseudoflavonifractor sp. An176 TaxID=1965572 RepID=UPI000B38F017|nr:radical SAM protein [Pseudoflavonifractor sp. An176]OUP62671.1 radical SAM protein [Pseudoflavonifractor sp. An176]